MNINIALVEDEPIYSKMISRFLGSYGYNCQVFETGNSFIDDYSKYKFSLVLLDWGLPDINGDKILEWIRKNMGWELPVIFVTAHDSPDDIVAMLRAGADDYMTKPVNVDELLARISAVMRRTYNDELNNIIEIEPYVINFNRHCITRNGDEVNLTPKEFQLTSYLLQNVGMLISRTKLLKNIWGYSADINTRTIDIHISRIRKKLGLLEENGWKLSSIYHEGYRLDRINNLVGTN